MTEITRVNLREELDRRFPELRDAVAAEIEEYHEPEILWFIVLESTFSKLMMSSLAEGHTPILDRVFAFVELLSLSSEKYVQELATDVLEGILGSGRASDRALAEAVMGPATRGRYKRARPYFRAPKN